MPQFQLLTVNENEGRSEVITARLHTYGFVTKTLELSFDADSTMSLSVQTEHGRLRTDFINADIDSLIEYLQEAKQFISEEQLVRKLCGVK